VECSDTPGRSPLIEQHPERRATNRRADSRTDPVPQGVVTQTSEAVASLRDALYY